MTRLFDQLTGIVPPVFRENKKEESVAAEIIKKKITADNYKIKWTGVKKETKGPPVKKWWELW